MKINNRINSNIPNFGSIPLYKATLSSKKLFKKPQPIEAFVSMFEKSDLNKEALDYRNWMLTRFGVEVINEMEEKVKHPHVNELKFLMVEIPSFLPKKQVTALAAYGLGINDLFIGILQSKSEFAFFNKIKGAGSLILYALSKFAQIHNCKSIMLNSTRRARPFYKKLGFIKVDDSAFTLLKEDFRKFQECLEEKYHILPVKT